MSEEKTISFTAPAGGAFVYTAPDPNAAIRGRGVGTYTLAEANRVMRLRQCAATGHEWNVIQSIAGGPSRIICDQCGWGGMVTMGERPRA